MVSFEGFEDGLTGRFFRLNAKRPLGGGLFLMAERERAFRLRRKRQEADIIAAPAGMLDRRTFLAARGATRSLP